MYQLKAIGKLYGGSKNEIEIQSNYRKALKRLDTFSHVHLFYIVSKAGEWKLETQIVEIEGVEIRSGKVKIKKWDKAEQEVEIVDINPKVVKYILKTSADRYAKFFQIQCIS